MKLKDAYQAATVLHTTNVNLKADYTALLVKDLLEATVGGEAWYKL